MKLTLLICFVAVALAAPTSQNFNEKDIEVLSYENDNNGLGDYTYSFSQSDGTKQKQKGKLGKGNSIVVSGLFSWVAPNRHVYTVTYVADDKGYQPEVAEAPGLDPALVGSLLG